MTRDEPAQPVRDEADPSSETGRDPAADPARETLPLVPRGWLPGSVVLIA